jgi:hypothetical protein
VLFAFKYGRSENMSMLYAPVTHILPLTTIRRERLLPIPGRVVVRKGQRVSPKDVVAEANLAPEHIVLDLVRGLGVPPEQADALIARKAGEEVGEGDVIAGPVGLSRRVVRAPCPGKIVVAGDGQVLLEVDSKQEELLAAFFGVVAELVSTRGVIIETIGALIQAVWGNGRIDYGLLNIRIDSPEDMLTKERLDINLRSSVILGGHCHDEEVLTIAEDLPVRGMILSSMDSALIPVAQNVNYPILLIEGFGQLPMNPLAFQLLTTSERREVALNGEYWDKFSHSRPEIVITLPAEGSPPLPPDTDFLTPGHQVRVVAPPYKGEIGTILAVRSGLANLSNGLRAQAAQVSLDRGDEVVLPLANLEIIE